MKKILICGTRRRGYGAVVREELDKLEKGSFEIVEGCCLNSADAYAEDYGKLFGVKVYHFPSKKGDYLDRDDRMVNFCDEVIAFWDGISNGTAHTIASAVLNNKIVRVIKI